MGSGGGFLRHRASLVQIAKYHNDVVSSLKTYFSETSAKINSRFVGYSLNELTIELSDRLEETDLRSSLAVLISIESAFRVDYEYRCRRRLKDDVSKSFRAIKKTRSTRVSLDQDIFQTWSERRDRCPPDHRRVTWCIQIPALARSWTLLGTEARQKI